MKNLAEIKKCQNCNLYKTQKPLLEDVSLCDILVVGLSAKLVKFKNEKPLDERTLSGALIKELEQNNKNLNFYKTNLVKCVPLNGEGKLVYPNKFQCNACYSNLKQEIRELKPKVVVLLGKRVSSFIESVYGVKFINTVGFNYKIKKIDGINFLPVHHPSHVSVYKRKQKQEYITKITQQIK